MATTQYFETDLHPTAKSGMPDLKASTTYMELLISSFSGEHRIMIKLVDPKGKEQFFTLTREQAVALHDGIESACYYLQYIK